MILLHLKFIPYSMIGRLLIRLSSFLSCFIIIVFGLGVLSSQRWHGEKLQQYRRYVIFLYII